MTTGYIVVGGINSTDIYYEKSWSGSNGIQNENNYTADFTIRRHTKSRLVYNPAYPAQYWAQASGTLPLTWGNNDTIALHNKFGSAFKGHDFNLGVAIGEGRETVEMVKGTISAFAKSIRAIKKGRLDQAVRHLGLAPAGNKRRKLLDSGDVSSQWLAIQYGWKPMLQDIKNAAEAFEHLTSEPRTRKIRVHHSIYKTGNVSTSPANWYAHGTRRITKRLTAYVTEDLSSAPRSLGLLNPLSVAWELVPFSFVADWFIPVGNYLEAVAATPPHWDVFITEGVKDVSTGITSGADIINTSSYASQGFADNIKRIHIERNPGVGISTPRPQFKSLREAYNVDRAKNAIALAHQLFRSK